MFWRCLLQGSICVFLFFQIGHERIPLRLCLVIANSIAFLDTLRVAVDHIFLKGVIWTQHINFPLGLQRINQIHGFIVEQVAV